MTASTDLYALMKKHIDSIPPWPHSLHQPRIPMTESTMLWLREHGYFKSMTMEEIERIVAIVRPITQEEL